MNGTIYTEDIRFLWTAPPICLNPKRQQLQKPEKAMIPDYSSMFNIIPYPIQMPTSPVKKDNIE